METTTTVTTEGTNTASETLYAVFGPGYGSDQLGDNPRTSGDLAYLGGSLTKALRILKQCRKMARRMRTTDTYSIYKKTEQGGRWISTKEGR